MRCRAGDLATGPVDSLGGCQYRGPGTGVESQLCLRPLGHHRPAACLRRVMPCRSHSDLCVSSTGLC